MYVAPREEDVKKIREERILALRGEMMKYLLCFLLFAWVISFVGWIVCFALFIVKRNEKISGFMCLFSALMIIFSMLKNGVA